MYYRKLIFNLIGVMIIVSCNSTKNNYSNSVLWEISSAKTEHISYILGTVHVLDTTKINFPVKEIKNLMDKSENLCVELISENVNGMEMLNKYLYLSEDKLKISDYLEKEYYAKLLRIIDSSKVLLKNYKQDFDSIRPTILSFFIDAEKQLSKIENINNLNYFPEIDLISYATEKKYEVISLETAEQQIQWIVRPSLSFDKSLDILKESIKSFDDKNSGMNVFMNYSEQKIEFRKPKTLLDSITVLRNRLMASKIDDIIKNRNLFVVIGAGHLPYKNGVLNLLAKKGYRINAYKIDLTKK